MVRKNPTPTLIPKPPASTAPNEPTLPATATDVTCPHTHPPLYLSLSAQAKGGITGQLPELLTLQEVCMFLKVKPSYIYSLTATDRIPNRKFAGTLRFVKTELLQWLDRGRRGPR